VNKQVSSTFAVIVILVVVALGALYFMVRYRAHEEAWKRESAMLQAQATRAQESGRSRMRRGMMGGRGGGMRMRGAAPGSTPGAPAQAGKKGEAPGAPAKQPRAAEKPKAGAAPGTARAGTK